MKNTTKETIKYWYRGICNILLSVIAICLFTYIWRTELNLMMIRSFENKGNVMMIIVYGIVVITFVTVFGGYKIGVCKKADVILSQIMALFVTNCIEIVITILVVGQVRYIGAIILCYLGLIVVQSVCLGIVTAIVMGIYQKVFPPYRMVQIVGNHKNNLFSKMNARSDKYQICEQINCDEPWKKIETTIKSYDAVLINDIPSEMKNRILKICFQCSKRVYFTPKISDIIIKYSDELNLFDTPLYLCRNLGLTLPHRIIKRIMDVFISLVGIIITSPIMLVTAIAIKAYDGGPALYSQKRSTISGKEFNIYKFRSMITDAEKDGKARLATENDSRITPIGKFIRATRIDELPQFFNILWGDMSIVGPRPERPEIIREYCAEVPEFVYRLHVKAGLTGYAQVYGKYNTTSYDKLKLDMIYVERASVLLDIKLVLLTLKVVFQKEATEGLEEGSSIASTSKESDF